jgi:hypothetical protein
VDHAISGVQYFTIGKSTRHLQGIRVDYQLSSKTRIMGKASGQKSYDPFGNGSSTTHPASTIDTDERNQEYIGQFTQVLSNRMLNEVRGGYSHYGFANNTLVTWSKHWQAPRVTNGYPRLAFTGFSVNANQNAPRHRDQKVWQIRDDFTTSYDARGHHDLKLGGEFVRHFEDSENCAMCGGNVDARNGHCSRGSTAVVFPRSVQRGHVELRRHVALHQAVHDRHRPVPESVRSAEVRWMGAG